MPDMLFIVGAVIVMLFGFVIMFGAPYLPTMKSQVDTALKIANLPPGGKLLELGSGDGRVMLAAAKNGINVTGYELNPILAVVSYFVTWKYRKQVTVVWGSFWSKKLPEADAIFVFLLPRYMSKLDKKIIQETSKPCKLISYAFQVPGKQADDERNGLYLYSYR